MTGRAWGYTTAHRRLEFPLHTYYGLSSVAYIHYHPRMLPNYKMWKKRINIIIYTSAF